MRNRALDKLHVVKSTDFLHCTGEFQSPLNPNMKGSQLNLPLHGSFGSVDDACSEISLLKITTKIINFACALE